MRFAPLVIVAGFVAAGVPALADTVKFTGLLAPEDTGAPQPSSAKGSAQLSLDTATKTLTWTVEYSGLKQPVKSVSCGSLEAAAGPAINVTRDLASPVKGSKALSDADMSALVAGRWVCVIGAAEDEAELGGEIKRAP